MLAVVVRLVLIATFLSVLLVTVLRALAVRSGLVRSITERWHSVTAGCCW